MDESNQRRNGQSKQGNSRVRIYHIKIFYNKNLVHLYTHCKD